MFYHTAWSGALLALSISYLPSIGTQLKENDQTPYRSARMTNRSAHTFMPSRSHPRSMRTVRDPAHLRSECVSNVFRTTSQFVANCERVHKIATNTLRIAPLISPTLSPLDSLTIAPRAFIVYDSITWRSRLTSLLSNWRRRKRVRYMHTVRMMPKENRSTK